jgi:hypothetical protein
MPSLSSFLSRPWRSLSGHLGRLGRSFEALAGQVREALARSIGRTVADAVAEAVHAALADSPADAALLPAPSAYPGRPLPVWDESDGPAWRDATDYPRDPDQPRDPYAVDGPRGPDRPRDPYTPNDDSWDEEHPDVPLPGDDAPSEPRARPWRRAVAAGCRAAAWWLELHPGPWSPVVAVGVGLVAGTAALVRGAPVFGGAGVAAAVLGLLALFDAVRCGAALLASAPAW